MTPEERQVAGPALNALKDEVNAALAARKASLADAALEERLKGEWLDVTLPSRPRRMGTIHPVSQVTEEVTAIFADMGFAVAEGRRSTAIGTISTRSTSPAITRRGPRWTRSTWRAPRATTARPMCCARTPRPCRSGRWRRKGAPLRIICAGPGLSRRLRPDPHADVPSGRGAGDGPRHLHGEPEMGAGGILSRPIFGTEVKTRFRASHFPFTEPSRRGRHPVFL